MIINIGDDILKLNAMGLLNKLLADKTTKKNIMWATDAEIPFTRYFYKYQQPVPSEQLKSKFLELERSVTERIKDLFE